MTKQNSFNTLPIPIGNIPAIFLMVILMLATLQPAFARKEKKAKAALSATQTDEKFNKYYLESIVQREKGNFTAQFDLLQRALEIKPDAPEALFDLAQAAARKAVMKPEEIEALYKKAIDKSPTENPFYLETFGKYAMAADNYQEAIPIFKKLAANELKRETAYQMLVAIYEQQQDQDNLLATLNEWEKAEGSSEELLNMKMKALFQMKRIDEGIEIADQLIRENPDNDYYPIARAEAYLQKGDTASAWKAYEEVVKTNPDNLSAQTFRIYYFQATHNKPQLLNACEAVILNEAQPTALRISITQSFISNLKGTTDEKRIDNLFRQLWQQPMDDAQLPELYGQYLASKNAPDSAYIPCMKKLLEINPTNDHARLMLIQDRLNNRDYQTAADMCQEGIKYNSRRLLYYHIGGGALYQQKRIAEALQIFSKGVPYTVSTKDKDIVSNFYASYADALHESGDSRQSYACYDSSLVYNPANVICLNNYAYFLSLSGERLDEAEQMSARVLKLEPDNPTYIDTYAWILFVRKDYEQARAYIEQALKLVKDETEDASLYEHAGDIYIQLGRKKEAQQAWRKAQQLGDSSSILKQKIKKSKYIPK